MRRKIKKVRTVTIQTPVRDSVDLFFIHARQRGKKKGMT